MDTVNHRMKYLSFPFPSRIRNIYIHVMWATEGWVEGFRNPLFPLHRHMAELMMIHESSHNQDPDCC